MASITAISADKFAVFGGLDQENPFLNNGYIYNLSSQQIKPILGRENDLGFTCYSQTSWIGKQRHVTLGEDEYGYVHLV